MKVQSVLIGAASYTVGVYVLQRYVLKRQLGLPVFLDPLGKLLGYPGTVAPAGTHVSNDAIPADLAPGSGAAQYPGLLGGLH